jgi:cytochrome c oxidase cbb3-type subunit 3
MGNRDLGAPNLTDAIWLYGGTEEAITQTIQYSRFGVMPPWGERLGEAQVRAVSAYVHGLGGGEAAIADPMTDAAAEEAAAVPDASYPASAEETPTAANEDPVMPEGGEEAAPEAGEDEAPAATQ